MMSVSQNCPNSCHYFISWLRKTNRVQEEVVARGSNLSLSKKKKKKEKTLFSIPPPQLGLRIRVSPSNVLLTHLL
jgi:hypothetical protein